jgi:formylglycine-generating enzyme required for sulfatase activity
VLDFGIPADSGQGVGATMVFVWIPPGEFDMGSPDWEEGRDNDEGPVHPVRISKGFWMGKCEVTQREYQAVTGSNPSFFLGDPDLPVERVSWYDASAYCGMLTQQERAAGRIATYSMYRLPTETEWEYACRAQTSTRFSYGDDPGCTNLPNYAWYSENTSAGAPQPVGLKLPNAWGLHDMHGNLWEWCRDNWSDDLPGGMALDPQGPATGWTRVIRGGCGGDDATFCRSASRSYCVPGALYLHVGFRVVLSAGEP